MIGEEKKGNLKNTSRIVVGLITTFSRKAFTACTTKKGFIMSIDTSLATVLFKSLGR